MLPSYIHWVDYRLPIHVLVDELMKIYLWPQILLLVLVGTFSLLPQAVSSACSFYIGVVIVSNIFNSMCVLYGSTLNENKPLGLMSHALVSYLETWFPKEGRTQLVKYAMYLAGFFGIYNWMLFVLFLKTWPTN